MKRTAKISVLLVILTVTFMILSMQDDISKAQLYGQLTCVFSIITMFVAFASWNTSGNQEKVKDMIEIVDDEQQRDTMVVPGDSDIGEKEDQIALENQSENEVNSCSSSDDIKPEINDEGPSETEKTVSDDNDFNDEPIIVDEEDDEM